MTQRILHLAAAPFEAARRVAILPEGHRARRLQLYRNATGKRIRRLLHPRTDVAGASMQGDILTALIGDSDPWLAEVARQGRSA